MQRAEVIVVGGGVSGIACARTLHNRGIDYLLVEGADRLGGRVSTDSVDGYLCDRGFQVFNSSYEKSLELLAGTGISFRNFRSGALIRRAEGFYPICDPLREPRFLLRTLFSPVGTLVDRLKVLRLRRDVLRNLSFEQERTIDELTSRGFSPSFIEEFFRPFLGGIFLERDLATNVLSFQSVFRSFTRGLALLPAGGMGEIASAMAAPLIKNRIILNQRVVSISKNLVRLQSGEEILGDAVIAALDADSLSKLFPNLTLPKTREVSNFYFSSEPIAEMERLLVLNGLGRGVINNVVDLTSVQPSYAPSGERLLSVAVLGEFTDEVAVRRELEGWFPGRSFTPIKRYVVRGALPGNSIDASAFDSLGILACGDLFGPPSIEGAVASGIRVGERALR